MIQNSLWIRIRRSTGDKAPSVNSRCKVRWQGRTALKNRPVTTDNRVIGHCSGSSLLHKLSFFRPKLHKVRVQQQGADGVGAGEASAGGSGEDGVCADGSSIGGGGHQRA